MQTNESWVVVAGDVVIGKKAAEGIGALTPGERLLYGLWVVDYAIRNAGDLSAAEDLQSGILADTLALAESSGATELADALQLPAASLEEEYYDRFDRICDQVRSRAAIEP